MVRYRIITAVFILIFIFSSCSKEDPIIVRVGENQIITIDELKESFNTEKDFFNADSVKICANLDSLINIRIMTNYCYKQGLDRDSTVLKSIEPIERFYLTRRLYEKKILSKQIKEGDIRDFYNHMDRDVLIRYIYFQVPSGSGKDEEEKIKTRAENVLRRLKQGEDFEKIEQEYSRSTRSGYVGIGTDSISWNWSSYKNPVENTAFLLKEGSISGLIRGHMAYYIIKVEKIRKKERRPYNELRGYILNQLENRDRRILLKKKDRYRSRVLAEHKFSWNNEGIKYFFERLGINGPVYCDMLIKHIKENFTDEEKSTVLATFDNKVFTIKEFIDRLEWIPPKSSIRLYAIERLKGNIRLMVAEDILVEIAKREGLDSDRFFKEKIREEKEKAMIVVLLKKIYGDIEPEEEDLRRFYNESVDSLYSVPERVVVQEVLVTDRSKAEKIVKIARRGESFSRLVEQFSERSGFKKIKGKIGPFERGMWGRIGEEAFKMKEGEIAGPIELENNKGYSIIKLISRIPIQRIPFNEIKRDVIDDYIENIKRRKLEAWLAEKRQEIPVTIYRDVLKRELEGL